MASLLNGLHAKPEMRLLLQAARPNPTHVDAHIATAIADGIDWDGFIGYAMRHRVLPQVADALVESPALPPAVAGKLRMVTLHFVGRQLLMVETLRDALDLFEKARIPALPLKGPRLARWLYGDPAKRISHDLDILVRPEDAGRAAQLMVDAGFKFPEFYDGVGAEDLAKVAANVRECEVPLYDEKRQTLLELHWSPFREASLRGTTAGIWDEMHQRPYPQGEDAPVSEVTLLAYLLIHGGAHRYHRLSWLVDIAALAERLDPSVWRDAIRMAREDGMETAALLGPVFANVLLGAPMPEGIDDRLAVRAEGIRDLAERCVEPAEDGDGLIISETDSKAYQFALPDERSEAVRRYIRSIAAPRAADVSYLVGTRLGDSRTGMKVVRPLALALRPVLAVGRKMCWLKNRMA